MQDPAHRIFRIGYWVAGSPALGFVPVVSIDNTTGKLSEETLDLLIPRLIAVLRPAYGGKRDLVLHPEDLAEPDEASAKLDMPPADGNRTMAWMYSHLNQDKLHDHAIYCAQIVLAYVAGEHDAEGYVLAARQRFPKISFAHALTYFGASDRAWVGDLTTDNNFLCAAAVMASTLSESLLERAGSGYSDDPEDTTLITAREQYRYLAEQSQL